MSRSIRLRTARIAIWFCMAPALFSFWAAAAQEKPATQPPASSREAASKAGEKPVEGEAAEEEALRHSAPVRFLARITGLSDTQAYWLCVIINFAIVLYAVVYAWRKKLPGLFHSRTEAIQKHLEEARKTGEEARRRLGEVEARLARLDEEIGAMRREAEENARAEDRRVQAEVEQERRRIVASAEQEIAMAAGAARRELQGYAADLAVDLAGKKIRVDSDIDQALVRDFTSWLGEDGN
jgi:F-type H+-transporting ATPase subunit b